MFGATCPVSENEAIETKASRKRGKEHLVATDVLKASDEREATAKMRISERKRE